MAVRRKAVVENVIVRRVVDDTGIGVRVLKRDETSFPFSSELSSAGYCGRDQQECGRAQQGEGTSSVHKGAIVRLPQIPSYSTAVFAWCSALQVGFRRKRYAQ